MYASQRYHDLRPKIAFCRKVKTIFTEQNSPPKCASFVLQNVSSTMVLQQIHSMFNNKDTESPDYLFRIFLLKDRGSNMVSGIPLQEKQCSLACNSLLYSRKYFVQLCQVVIETS